MQFLNHTQAVLCLYLQNLAKPLGLRSWHPLLLQSSNEFDPSDPTFVFFALFPLSCSELVLSQLTEELCIRLVWDRSVSCMQQVMEGGLLTAAWASVSGLRGTAELSACWPYTQISLMLQEGVLVLCR